MAKVEDIKVGDIVAEPIEGRSVIRWDSAGYRFVAGRPDAYEKPRAIVLDDESRVVHIAILSLAAGFFEEMMEKDKFFSIIVAAADEAPRGVSYWSGVWSPNEWDELPQWVAFVVRDGDMAILRKAKMLISDMDASSIGFYWDYWEGGEEDLVDDAEMMVCASGLYLQLRLSSDVIATGGTLEWKKGVELKLFDRYSTRAFTPVRHRWCKSLKEAFAIGERWAEEILGKRNRGMAAA